MQIVSRMEGAVWREQFAVADHQRIPGTHAKQAQGLEDGLRFWQLADRAFGLKSCGNGRRPPGAIRPGEGLAAVGTGGCCFCHGRFRGGRGFVKGRSGNIQRNGKSNKPEKAGGHSGQQARQGLLFSYGFFF